MTVKVKVTCNSRLHMGFFDLNGNLGRKFGSIGLSLDAPAIQLSAVAASELSVSGGNDVPESVLAKAKTIAEVLIEKLALKPVTLDIQQHIPEHAGLGSGTQMALAVGTALSRLFALDLNAQQIALLCQRGRRSGIGIAAFEQGGLLIDGGRALNSNIAMVPPLLARYAFPQQWHILLIFDHSQPGVHGQQELAAFDALPAFPEALAANMCRQVLMCAMPALVEQDLLAFGKAIQTLQQQVGDYFAPAQGGRYASKAVSDVLYDLQQTGVTCFGQSSWGPTGFAIYESEQVALQQLQQLKSKFSAAHLSWQLCKASNRGAQILVTE